MSQAQPQQNVKNAIVYMYDLVHFNPFYSMGNTVSEWFLSDK